ncbi:MAG: DUF2238 domain-containing protein [Alphaproteobacteria bacterium]|nr:DUF2238 domain-containing protein [Alphaproteobacteria bacterium]
MDGRGASSSRGRLGLALALSLAAVVAWSAIEPTDRLIWWMEAAPALIAALVIAAFWRRFPLTDLLLVLAWAHAAILLVGAHYTYSLVPLGDWGREAFGFERNHYDRLGHLAQGFVPAIAARELLLRLTPLRRGGWLVAIVALSCLGISALYELIEWLAAELVADGAVAFLAAQGDVWDAQKDMAFAGIGALAALLLLGRLHDRRLAALPAAPRANGGS